MGYQHIELSTYNLSAEVLFLFTNLYALVIKEIVLKLQNILSSLP